MNSTNVAALDFPTNTEEAAERFQLYKNNDPFQKTVSPALLNSADIYDYVRVTGMLFPFDKDDRKLKEKLKGASYEIDLLGEVYWSDDKGKLQKQRIQGNSVFKLKKNSIVFVYLDTFFRLPHYMAVRFNLRITHVHRGLLLGTGPLVDPGFVGRLLIPLHNLTSEDYALVGGEGFIWAEFTKLSPFLPNEPLIRESVRTQYELQPNKTDLKGKTDLKAQTYFNRASSGVPARSSIPGEVSEAKKIAEETSKKVSAYTRGAIIGGALAVVGVVSGTWSLISVANKHVADSSHNIAESRQAVDSLSREVERLRMRVLTLEKSVSPEKAPSQKPTTTQASKPGTKGP